MMAGKVEKSKSRRVEESKSQTVQESKGRRVESSKSPRVERPDRGVPRLFDFSTLRLFDVVTLGLSLACVSGCQRVETKEAPPTVAAAAPSDRITTPSGVDMVLVPAGQFVMGSDRGEDDEKPAHPVQVSAFYMDATEVTQESFQRLTGNNPSKSKQPDLPAERVSWVAAVQYCNLRSQREGLKPCYDLNTFACDFAADGYRLPTEAEWEYACRAGSQTAWSCGDAEADLEQSGWFKGNADKKTHPVKQKKANAWGLYDMHGNVAEWCHDYYAEGYAATGPAQDPRGPGEGDVRVVRGGSFAVSADACRSSARGSQTPAFADACFGAERHGFRCVRRAAPAP